MDNEKNILYFFCFLHTQLLFHYCRTEYIALFVSRHLSPYANGTINTAVQNAKIIPKIIEIPNENNAPEELIGKSPKDASVVNAAAKIDWTVLLRFLSQSSPVSSYLNHIFHVEDDKIP